MKTLNKQKGKRLLALTLVLTCFFSLVSPQTLYAAPANVTLPISVEQIFDRPSSYTGTDTFTYRLTALNPANPLPAGSVGNEFTFTLDGTETETIGSITYTQTGVYDYEIRQVITPARGFDLDDEVYTIEVNVPDYSTVQITVWDSNGDKVTRIEFDNKYEPMATDPALMVDPPVKKTVSGVPSADGTFTFKLEAANPSSPMPAGSQNGVKILTIQGSGEDDFGTWAYTQAGLYYYTVSEVNTNEQGYTYDNALYTITDDVKDVAGQLELTRTVTNDAGRAVTSYSFINTYTGSPVAGKASPKTGDDSQGGLYRGLFIGGGAIFVACGGYLALTRTRTRKLA